MRRTPSKLLGNTGLLYPKAYRVNTPFATI